MRQLIPSCILEITGQMFPRRCYGKLRIKWYRIALCFLLPTIITACSTRRTNIKPDQPLKIEKGMLVIHFHPTHEGFDRLSEKAPLKIIIHKVEEPPYRKGIIITSPDSLKVITLPAGKYKWKSLSLKNTYWRFSEDSSFVVQAGKMIYLGDIYCHFKSMMYGTGCQIAVKDKYEVVLKLLNIKYPSMVQKYGLSKSLATMKFKK